MTPQLAPTASCLGTDLKRVCQRLHRDGWRAIQLSAAMDGVRPRDLGPSARRDLVAMLRRQELTATGLDLWIPCEHFLDETTVDRAIAAIEAGCELAADLGLSTLSVQLPASDTVEETVIEAMVTAANRHGVTLADHRVDGDLPVAKGLDPAACLSSDRDPVEMLLAIGPALAAARLSDLSMTGLRTPAGSTEGRLDVAAYQAAVTTLTQAGVVALDLRQLTSPWQAAAAGRLAWERAAALWA